MSVIPDFKIRKFGTSGVITPYDPTMVQPASYDCKLGNEFVVFDKHEETFIDLADVHDSSARTVHKDDKFVLHPGEFILGVTAERVNIPGDIVARIEGKSSMGRLGIMIHVTAGYIDPGFRGPITLEMVNLRSIPIVLRPGLPVCQLSFHEMTDPPSQTYQGRYQDATGVEPSRYGQPAAAFNVDRPITPHSPRGESMTCVPHGVYNCPICLASHPPRGSDPEVI